MGWERFTPSIAARCAAPKMLTRCFTRTGANGSSAAELRAGRLRREAAVVITHSTQHLRWATRILLRHRRGIHHRAGTLEPIATMPLHSDCHQYPPTEQ